MPELGLNDLQLSLLGQFQVLLARASRTLKGITSAWIADQKVIVEDGKISEYRVVMKITFVLEN